MHMAHAGPSLSVYLVYLTFYVLPKDGDIYLSTIAVEIRLSPCSPGLVASAIIADETLGKRVLSARSKSSNCLLLPGALKFISSSRWVRF